MEYIPFQSNQTRSCGRAIDKRHVASPQIVYQGPEKSYDPRYEVCTFFSVFTYELHSLDSARYDIRDLSERTNKGWWESGNVGEDGG